jgi:hypothetical protein
VSEIESLLRERAGYVMRNLTDRIRAVDVALAALGHKTAPAIETAAVAPPETATVKTRRARTTTN